MMGECGALNGEGGCQIEVDQHRPAFGSGDQDIAGIDVLVHHACPMHGGDGPRQLQCNVQKLRNLQPLLDQDRR